MGVQGLPSGPRLVPLDPWRELVLHVLAFVPAAGAASLYASGYAAFVRGRFPPEAFAQLDEDAPLLARLHDQGGIASAGVEVLPWCFATASRMRSALRAGPEAWEPGMVDHPAALALARSPLASLSSLTALVALEMALAAEAFLTGYTAHLAAEMEAVVALVAPWFAAAQTVAPRGAAEASCGLSAVLGPRGRVYPRLVAETPAVIVGAPLAYTGLPASHPALQWLHERAVVAAYATLPGGLDAGAGYLHAEALAWGALEVLVGGSPLEAPHRAWRGRFDARAVQARGQSLEAGEVAAVVGRLRG